MKTLKLRVGPKGEGVVFLDGDNISHQCIGVDIQAYAGEVTKVTLAITHLELDIDVPVEGSPEFFTYPAGGTFH